jgi:dihydrofolate reductase
MRHLEFATFQFNARPVGCPLAGQLGLPALNDTVASTNAPIAPTLAAPTLRPRIARITIVAAIAANGVIGKDNALPWRLREDLQHFRQLTTGHTIVMGRKTFESLGRLLPERTHVVISRNGEYVAAGCLVANSLADALARCAGEEEVFVIGGAEVYRQALAVADRLQITEIHRDFPGDAFFPDIDRSAWGETVRECHQSDAGLGYDLVTYDRK